jgi:hypothetical protein
MGDRGLTRRRYLAAVPGAVSLAGCLGFPGDDGGSTVEEPALVNLALQYIGIGTAHIDFEVEQNGEQVHSETYEMEGVDPTDVEQGSGAIGSDVGDVRRFEGEPWMDERATYAVTTDLHSAGAATYTTQDYLDEYGDRGCPEFVIVIGVVNDLIDARGGPAPPDCINPVPVP